MHSATPLLVMMMYQSFPSSLICVFLIRSRACKANQFRLDVAGFECEEYRKIIEYMQSREDWKHSPPSHPVRTLGSVMEKVGVEDTEKGPVVVVSGMRVLVPSRGL